MHLVDRGVEPNGLEEIRDQYTPRWVRHYECGVGIKPPSDSRWREFRPDLESAFGGLCAYCEELCRGSVDHFQPKSKFPRFVYVWSNWLFSCSDCNLAKLNNWPNEGYVDPCDDSPQGRPEAYFDFDFDTGGIHPKADLSATHRRRAENTIRDLDLNRSHHRTKRMVVVGKLSMIENWPVSEQLDNLCLSFARRTQEVSSIARAWLFQKGYTFDT